jgi:cbb3-type cytochrome oxidase maturation protein
MEVIYGLLPGMLLLGLVGVVIFFWAVKSGQYDDMDGAAHRMLLDDDMEIENSDDSVSSEHPQEARNQEKDKQ